MPAIPSNRATTLFITRVGVVRGDSFIRLHYEDAAEDDCACDTAQQASPFALENDCACDQPLPAARPLPPGNYRACKAAYLEEIAPGYMLALATASPIGPVVMNQAAQAEWQRYGLPRPLENTLGRWLASAGLLNPVEQPARLPTSNRGQLTAWLHITDACNLDCPYCYVRHSRRTMPVEVGLRAVREVFSGAQQSGCSSVKLKFAGGEASLHFDRVRTLHAEALRCSADCGVALKAVVLSNGVALRAADVDWLAETGTRLMISLDGVGTAHDRLRFTKDGRGTFARIEHNVDHLLLSKGVNPSISITITGQNTAAAADAVRWALERELPVSLNFYRTPPGRAASADLALDAAQVIAAMQAVYNVFEEMLPKRPFLHGLLDRFQPEVHERTCGAGGLYWVIGPDGERAACHMLLEPALRNHPAAALQNLPITQRSACSDCEFRYYCTGGCPLEGFRASGRWDATNPNCAIYRSLIPAALRLEGLRLLKQNDLL